MRDAGRKLTECPQLLGLRGALLRIATIRDVSQHDQGAGALAADGTSSADDDGSISLP